MTSQSASPIQINHRRRLARFKPRVSLPKQTDPARQELTDSQISQKHQETFQPWLPLLRIPDSLALCQFKATSISTAVGHAADNIITRIPKQALPQLLTTTPVVVQSMVPAPALTQNPVLPVTDSPQSTVYAPDPTRKTTSSV